MSNAGPFVGAAIEGGPPPPERTGNRQGGLAESPYNVYPTKDGHVAVICVTDQHWVGLTEAMGRPDLLTDPVFATKPARIRAMDAVDELVAAWTSVQPTDEVFALLRRAGVVCAPARSLGEVIADPYFRERGMIVDVDVPGVGPVPLIHTPLYFSDRDRLPLDPAHELGQDNDAVFGDLLGHPAEVLETYRAAGVI
jgi:CoA:oxalate CoA-transferase